MASDNPRKVIQENKNKYKERKKKDINNRQKDSEA